MIFQNVSKLFTDMLHFNVSYEVLVNNYYGHLYSYFRKLTFDSLDFAFCSTISQLNLDLREEYACRLESFKFQFQKLGFEKRSTVFI